MKLYQSFKYALSGIVFAVEHNQNIRIHTYVAVLVIAASIFFDVTPFEMGILGIMILLVISTEMINTSLEEMTNLITREHHREAKIAKDVGAGMVLVTSVGSLIVGTLIFTPHITRLLQSH